MDQPYLEKNYISLNSQQTQNGYISHSLKKTTTKIIVP